MKSNSFTNLVIIAIFATVGNLTCIAMGSNEVTNAAMELMRANPKIVWGETTNFVTGNIYTNFIVKPLKPLPTSLRAGIDARDGVIILSGQPLKVSNPAGFHVFTDSIQAWAGIPPFNESVILSMTDSNGMPVPKTVKGLALGQALTLKPETRWMTWDMNNRNPWFKIYSTADFELMKIGTGQEKYASPGYFVVNPTQYFSIKTPGLYKLTVTLRLYVVDTNTYLKSITLPPVTVPVRLEGDGE